MPNADALASSESIRARSFIDSVAQLNRDVVKLLAGASPLHTLPLVRTYDGEISIVELYTLKLLLLRLDIFLGKIGYVIG